MDALIVICSSILGRPNNAVTQSVHRWDFCLTSAAAKIHLPSLITSYLLLSPHKRAKKLHLRHWSRYATKSRVSHNTNEVSWTPQPTGGKFSGQVTLLHFLITMWCTLLHIPAATLTLWHQLPPNLRQVCLANGKDQLAFLLSFFSVKPYFIWLIHH